MAVAMAPSLTHGRWPAQPAESFQAKNVCRFTALMARIVPHVLMDGVTQTLRVLGSPVLPGGCCLYSGSLVGRG